jgi:polyisoprenoid-binding protein YceI
MAARSWLLTAFLVLAVPTPLVAQHAIPQARLKEGTLSFDGHATVGDFVGLTSTVAGEMTGGSDLSTVRGWVEAPVQTLKTGNDHRDRDLNKSMESDQYPNLRFELTGVMPEVPVGDSVAVTLHGSFTIHGVSREVDLPGSVVLQPETIRVHTQFPLNLKDYKIGGLSKMLGVLKMNPGITVHVDLVFEPRAP